MSKTYDLKQVDLIVGGIRFSGYGEDGGIEVTPAANVTESTVDADGGVTSSRTNDKRLFVDITFRESALGYRRMGELQQAQDNVEGAIPPQDFYMLDKINGDEISDEFSIFETIPDITKARLVGERTFRLMLPKGRENMVMGGLIVQ